jgi:phospholipid transport system substrate-binding protein
MMSNILCGIILGMSLILAPAARGQDAPDVLAKKVTDEVITAIRSDKDISAGNSDKVLSLVESKVLPHFDFTHMTRLAVGASWRQASAAQQQSLTSEFRKLLVHTYTSAFAQYRDQVIQYRPLKLQPSETDVVVRSQIKQSNGNEPIDVNYSMEKIDQAWKVYDVTIAGVSLVQNYRSSFNSEIQKSGIDGLIASLAKKNKSLGHQQAAKK